MVASRSLYACVILPLSGSLARAVRDARSASLPPGIEVPTHITVLPPWRASAGEINALLTHTATVGETCSPFEVSSGEIGTFEPISPVVYLDIARGRESIFRLHRQLKAGVPGADFRFPFVPHITLAQIDDDAQLDAVREHMADFSGSSLVTDMCVVTGPSLEHWSEQECVKLSGPGSR